MLLLAPYIPFQVHTSCILHSFTLHAVLYQTFCTLHDAVCTLFHESCTLHSPRFLPALRTPHSTSPSLQPTRHLQSHVSLLLLPHVLSCKCLALSLHLSTCHLHTVSLENVLDHCFSLLSSSLPSCVVISLFTSILPWRWIGFLALLSLREPFFVMESYSPREITFTHAHSSTPPGDVDEYIWWVSAINQRVDGQRPEKKLG